MLYYIQEGQEKAIPLEPLDRGLTQDELDTLITCIPNVLGEELLLLDYQYRSFTRYDNRADILALSDEGQLVIIGFRQGVADDAELKTLEYAANLSDKKIREVAAIYAEGAAHKDEGLTVDQARKILQHHLKDSRIHSEPRIVILARDVRPALANTILWLHSRGLDISYVRFQAYVAESTWIIDVNHQEAVPSAEVLGFASSAVAPQAGPAAEDDEEGENGEHSEEPEETGAAEGVGEEKPGEEKVPVATMAEQHPHSTLLRHVEELLTVQPLELEMTSYTDALTFATGIPNIYFDMSARSYPEQYVEITLSFTEDNIEHNRAIARAILARRESIEQALGEPIEVKDPWYRNWVKLYVVREWDAEDPAHAEEAISLLTRFINTLLPYVRDAAKHLSEETV